MTHVPIYLKLVFVMFSLIEKDTLILFMMYEIMKKGK